MGSFFELIAKRESCRSFSEKKVERDLLEKCIEAARLAPSACNSQPWSFIAVSGEETVRGVSLCLQELGLNEFTSKCPAFIIVTQEPARLRKEIAESLDEQQFAKIDIGFATAQLCLAATELGLGTCIIGWFNEAKLKELLNIAEEKQIRLVICVGYANEEEKKPKERKDIDEIATFM
jgi:nitroreductase